MRLSQAELLPPPLACHPSLSSPDTRAQRRARSGAAEGAGARATAQPVPKAASHPAALHLRGGGTEAPGSRSPRKAAAEPESPLGIKKLFLFVYSVPWAPTMSRDQSRFWGPKMNRIGSLD